MLDTLNQLSFFDLMKEAATGVLALVVLFTICYGIESKYKIFSKFLSALGDKLTVNVLTKVDESNDKRNAEINKRIDALNESLEESRKASIERYESMKSSLSALSDEFKADLATQYADMITFISESEATQARYRILRFNDEVIEGRRHSREHFDQVLEMIDNYQSYCEQHPNYENSKCVSAITNIQRVYQDCIHTGNF